MPLYKMGSLDRDHILPIGGEILLPFVRLVVQLGWLFVLVLSRSAASSALVLFVVQGSFGTRVRSHVLVDRV